MQLWESLKVPPRAPLMQGRPCLQLQERRPCRDATKQLLLFLVPAGSSQVHEHVSQPGAPFKAPDPDMVLG